MLYIIPLVIIVVCAAVIAVILGRKFPRVANLDVNNLSEEKILQKKKEIIIKRVEERGNRLRENVKKTLRPLGRVWGDAQTRFRSYFAKVETLLRHEQSVKAREQRADQDPQEREIKLSHLVQEAEQYLKLGDFEKAENLFISAVKVDPKAASAYRGLGDTYAAKNSLEEARQTYRFLLQLEPDDDSVLVKLAEIAESQGDLEEAIGYYQQAVLLNDSFSPRYYHIAELLLRVNQPKTAREAIVAAAELEPQNPKYLDLMTEIAIICGDKELAEKGMNGLRMVNPDNNKLDGFRERIKKMEVRSPEVTRAVAA